MTKTKMKAPAATPAQVEAAPTVESSESSAPLIATIVTPDDGDPVLTSLRREAAPVETKTYADGTVATGVAPLPDKSPAEQDAEGEKAIATGPNPFYEGKFEGETDQDRAERLQAACRQRDEEDVLAAAAATAQPGAAPAIEPQPPELAASIPPKPVHTINPIRNLADARALPQVGYDSLFEQLPPQEPDAIEFFKDDDGRTMRVVRFGQNLGKFHWVQS